MKHTKGKWSINTWENQKDPSIRIGAVGTPLIAQVPSTFVSINEQKANAKLIAAAPELLAACLVAREELIFGGDWKTAQRVIDNAVKKATE